MRTRNGSKEFVFQALALGVIVILVHTAYELVIRPRAIAAMERAAEIRESQPEVDVPQSLSVILKDYEQEACFILLFWALASMAYKGKLLRRDLVFLQRDFVEVEEGKRILPVDARDLSRQLQALPEDQRSALLPRTLLAALHRFESTRNVQDVSETVTQLCLSEGERQESELSMIRYIAWAIPSIGFIGTVRGIGLALSQAHAAVEGEIGPVTESLGTAFNSTLIALCLSILLMFVVHQLQLQQERYVLDVQDYAEEKLIRHLHVIRESRREPQE
ncbi:MAG: MotA/TolQ/ExbB proton channel family protein [Verrucomicrobia bacterium]|nr:MotA/TolQ/ExbB proton channel family protein [Verrucomicrobiota bacterium]MCH8525663.1 MotA/TolQ/ExbB proton channel family protein [Kiritimatiellia bacterium]